MRRSLWPPLVGLLALLMLQIGPPIGSPEVVAAPPLQESPPSRDLRQAVLAEGRPSPRKPWLREEFFNEERLGPDRSFPAYALPRARQQLEERMRSGAIGAGIQGGVQTAGVTEGNWVALGPEPITTGIGAAIGVGQLPNAGRVTSVAVVDAQTVYIGSASGGVWKTVDGGVTWTPLTDTLPSLTSLAVGALALDPVNPNIIYAGLGEQNNFQGVTYFGAGLLKSTNAGASWTLYNPPLFDRQAFGRIVVDINDTNIVYAATSAGVAKSTNGGQNWTAACLGPFCDDVTDVVIDSSTNPSTVYAANGFIGGDPDNGIWRTTTDKTNINANWTKLPGTAPNTFPTSSASGTGAGRIRLATTRGINPPTIYAAVHDVEDDGLLGVWKTSDGGTSWTQTTAHPESGLPAGSNAICTQCWYDLNVAVYPSDPNIVYVLAIELFRSTDGGATWTVVSNGYVGTTKKIHVDQHGFDFIPNSPNGFYVGNDGGVYRSTDAGATFSNLNQDLSITQFYRGAAHPTNVDSAIGGTQDNGTLSFEGSPNWYRTVGGDGGFAAVDPEHPNFSFFTAQNLALYRSITGPRGSVAFADLGLPCVADETGCAGGEPRRFIAPFVLDPSNSATLYAGTTRLYRSTDHAASWTVISPLLSSSNSRRVAISAIGVARSNPNTLYVGTASGGGFQSRFQVSKNGGTDWDNRSAGLPNRTVTGIAVHPTDSNTAYVTVSGFDAFHVWKTTDAGEHWQNVSADLPDTPANAVVVDPQDGQRVYVGTDVGVFKSTDGGGNWAALNSGLPNVIVSDLVLNRAGTRMFAFTHGRGVYGMDRRLSVPAITPSPTAVTNPTCGSFSTTENATAVPGPSVSSPKRFLEAPMFDRPVPRAEGRRIGEVLAPPSAVDVRPAGGPGWTTIVCETFEGAWPTGAWSTGDSNNAYNMDVCWGTDDFQPYPSPGSGKSAWHAKGCKDGVDPNDAFYNPSANSWMFYGPFSLVGATAAEVHFRLWHQIKGSVSGGQLSGDSISIYAFTPDSEIWGFFYTGSSTTTEPPTSEGWTNKVFDLANVPTLGSLLGEPEVYVAWRFLSDSGTGSASIDDGAFVDDVLIRKVGAAVTSTPTSTPSRTPTPTASASATLQLTPGATATPSATATLTPGAISGRGFTLQIGGVNPVGVATTGGVSFGLPDSGGVPVRAAQVVGPPRLTPTTIPSSASQAERAAIPPVARDKHPKMDSRLAAAARVQRTSGAVVALQQAAAAKLTVRGDAIRVIVEATDAAGVRSEILRARGVIEVEYGGLIQALLPPAGIELVAAHAGVTYVQVPARPYVEAVNGEQVVASNASAWQTAGTNGAGVKVAVIDGGFQDYALRQVSGDLPGQLTTQYFGCSSLENGDSHGTGVAEIVYEMAPAAQLYLICVDTTLNLAQAKDYAKAEGIFVVNHSVSWFNTSRGDGSGGPTTPNGIVADARANGILWVNAAGNRAMQHWGGTFVDSNGDDSHNFTPTDEGNTIFVPSGAEICALLRWDAWPTTNQDYDLFLFRSSDLNTQLGFGGQNDQAGTAQAPIEEVCYTNTGASGNFAIFITRYSATTTPPFDLYAPGFTLEHQVAARSVTEPASSQNAFAVAAICWQNNALEVYSGQGPTIDERVKPDIAGQDSQSSATYGLFTTCGESGFTGTSASSPTVAGAAALVKQANPAFTPAQVQDFLTGRAIDQGSAGVDNLFGHGRLNLGLPAGGGPTATPTTPPSNTPTATPSATRTATPTQPVSGAGDRTLTWLPGTLTKSAVYGWSPQSGFRLVGVRQPMEASITDTVPINDPIYCYIHLAFLGDLSNKPDVQAASDLLCYGPGTGSGAGAPGSYRGHLDQSTTLTVEWTAPGGQTRYEVTRARFDGSATESFVPSGALMHSEPIGDQATCLHVAAFNDQTLLGTTPVLCGRAGVETHPSGGVAGGVSIPPFPGPAIVPR